MGAIERIVIPEHYERGYAFSSGRKVPERICWDCGVVQSLRKVRYGVAENRCGMSASHHNTRLEAIKCRLSRILDEWTASKGSDKYKRIEKVWNSPEPFELSEVAKEYQELLKEYWETPRSEQETAQEKEWEEKYRRPSTPFKELFAFENWQKW